MSKLILWIDYNRNIIVERVAKIKKIMEYVQKYKNLNITMISLIYYYFINLNFTKQCFNFKNII